jgi:hypothetical protein
MWCQALLFSALRSQAIQVHLEGRLSASVMPARLLEGVVQVPAGSAVVDNRTLM